MSNFHIFSNATKGNYILTNVLFFPIQAMVHVAVDGQKESSRDA